MGKTNDQRVAKALEDIRAELDATALSSIAQHLTVLEKEYTTVSSFASSNLDDVEKLKIKTRELEKEVTEKQEEISKFSDADTVISDLKTQLSDKEKTLTEFLEKANKEKKENFLSMFEKVKDHANFEKIKPKLKIPEKDGTIDWDSLEIDDINNNYSKLSEFSEVGLFGDISEKTDVLPAGRAGEQVKDPLTLAKKDPEAYKAYRESKGFY